jgi:hypothetical protein
MKSGLLFFARVACVSLFLSASAVIAEHVRNGDFADGHRFWNVNSPEGLLQQAQKDGVTSVRGGVLSLDVSALRKGGRGVPADVRLWQKVTSLTPGRAYLLSFEARTSGIGARGTVNVRFGKGARLPDGNHNTQGGLSISHFDVTEDWAPFSYEFTFNGDGALELPKDLDACWLTFAVGNVNRFELRKVSLVEAR